MFIYPKNPTALEIISVSIQLAFNYWIYIFVGKFTLLNINLVYRYHISLQIWIKYTSKES